MTDEEYIRRAVELADGFEWDDEHHIAQLPDEWIAFDGNSLPQYFLDALAAQLVRQVDDISGETTFFFTSQYDGVYLWAGDYNAEAGRRDVFKAASQDRTANTIKAIVDSRVLE